MMKKFLTGSSLALAVLLWTADEALGDFKLQPLRHNDPDLLVDLGVGLWAWPLPMDYNGNGLTDLVMLDHEGYLALFRRERQGDRLVLLPGERVFRLEGEDGPMLLENGCAGRSGRRKLAIVDFNGNGRLDILLNSENASFLKNLGTENGITTFRDTGPLDERRLAGHTSSPSTINLDDSSLPGLLVGAEDGFHYYLPNPFFSREDL